jgi:bifunctional DNA-binding transcriptional regulator/antitoxin component of YhaV-PrlF toxin-antitoxin module
LTNVKRFDKSKANMKIVKVSSKNQITLPQKLLRDYKISFNDRVTICGGKDGIVIKPLNVSIVESVAGSLNLHVDPSRLGVSFEKIKRTTQKEVAKYLANK